MKSLQIFLVLLFQTICHSSASTSNVEEKVTEKSKKILAFGGNGFIGSGVLHNLLTKGTYKEVSIN
jgi:hypothetical protein